MRKFHTPIDPIYHSNVMLSTQTATCKDCGLPIESWELHDDDMGYFWTEWGVRKGNEKASTLDKNCTPAL